jgi:hypothetical protein
MLKLIYLARRKPGFTFDEFIRRWRMHGATAMATPLWRYALGYVQAEPILPSPVPGASDAFDAIACYMVADGMFTGMTEEDMAPAAKIAEDELETFSAPIPSTSLWVQEEAIKRGELGGITAFLFFADASTARETAERARDFDSLDRIILNLRDDDSLGPEANTLPYEAVVELSAASVPTLAAAIAADGGDLLPASDLAVVTREAVMWNRLARQPQGGETSAPTA